jgi:hypothetical protein
MVALITRSLGRSAALCRHADKLSTFFFPDVFHIYDSVLTSMSAVTTSLCLYLLFGCIAVEAAADFVRNPLQTPVDHSNRIRPGIAGCSVGKSVFLRLSSSGLLPHAIHVMMKTCRRSWGESFYCARLCVDVNQFNLEAQWLLCIPPPPPPPPL